MKAIDYEDIEIDGKLYINFWSPLFHLKREMTFSERKLAFLTFRLLERIWSSGAASGWVTWVAHEHTKVKAIVQKLGGHRFIETPDKDWFMKEF